MLDQRIARCVHLANASWPARLPKAALFGADGLAALASDSLLHAILEAAPVSTIEFERFLTCARHVLLEIASSPRGDDPFEPALLTFFGTLSRQCFVNEYIFDFSEREASAATTCLSTAAGTAGREKGRAAAARACGSRLFPALHPARRKPSSRCGPPQPRSTQSCASRFVNRSKSRRFAPASSV